MSDEQEQPLAPLQAPLPMPGVTSLADEEKAMRGGRGGLIVGLIFISALAIGGLGMAIMGGGSSAYSEFGRTINGLHTEKFNGFWTCTLQVPGAELTQIRSNTTMMEEIHVRGENGRKRFGDMVRERCIGELENLETALETLLPPEDLLENRTQMVEAVHALQGAWSSHRSYLNTLQSDPYDREAAQEGVTAITRSWFEYRRAHRALNQTIAGHLGEGESEGEGQGQGQGGG